MTSPMRPGGHPENDYRTGWLLQRAYRNARMRFTAGLAEMDIDAPHFGVLLALDEREPLTQTELAARNNSDRTAMVRTLDDLERLDYVRRTQSTTDRRVNEITLTPAGRAAFGVAQRAAVAASDGVFGGLSPRELAELGRLLAKVIAYAEQDRSG